MTQESNHFNTSQYNSEVFCSLQFEATHNWPDCPLEEVSYLRDIHRHIFHVTAWVNVSHGDRDVEFIQLKHQILKFIDERFPKDPHSVSPVYALQAMSCEAIAKILMEQFSLSRCQVSEDGENGAYLQLKSDIGNQ